MVLWIGKKTMVISCEIPKAARYFAKGMHKCNTVQLFICVLFLALYAERLSLLPQSHEPNEVQLVSARTKYSG